MAGCTSTVGFWHVRFTPDNDRESGFPHKIMSALPPKADIGPPNWHVRFVQVVQIALTIVGRRVTINIHNKLQYLGSLMMFVTTWRI